MQHAKYRGRSVIYDPRMSEHGGPSAYPSPEAGGPIRRNLLRDQVRLELIDRIVRGALYPAARLNEAELAAELQISRTPLKEAILALEREGFVQPSRGRGHIVTPLSRREVEESYPILMSHEMLVLARYPPSDATLDRMAEINDQLAKATNDPGLRLQLDEEFHAALSNGCPNQRLLRAIQGLELVIRRYHSRYPLRAIDPERSALEHRAVIAAARKRDTAGAVAALEQNWNHAVERLVAAMETDPPEQIGAPRTSSLGPLPR